MEQFEDGGLKDEGGTVDEVSGNKVPVGGTKKGVRDNIPAMVSEGEFIFPEDVTRYIGLDKLMQLRQDAKMGLKKMEAMGQMGNGDEATIDDDMPFGMADLIIVGGPMEEPQEKYKGGVLHAQQGTYVGQQQQQQPATGIAGYQPSMYANRAPINPYQYQAPASAFTPPTYQNTQVAPSQPTSGYMPKFVGQGVTRKTVTGRETPRVEAEQFVEDIYLDVKYINRETGDIRTFKFYQGEPISEIPAGYVPYEEGQDPATGTPPPSGTPAPTTTQVSRGRDDDRGPPPPPPFNWDEATPEAIVNEVNKIQGPAGSVMTGLAAVLNPALGAMVYAATKANEKQTLTKLDELLKDKAFVKKMSDAGQLKKLRDSLTELKEKTKGKGKGIVDIDLLGILGSAIKGVAKALGLTPEEEKEVIKNSVSDAAGIAPPKRPEQEVEEPIITLAQQAEAESQVSLDVFGGEGDLPETTSVLGETSVLRASYDEVPTPTQLETLKQAKAEEAMGLSSFGGSGKLTPSQIANVIAATEFTTASSIIDNIIAESRKETAPVVKDDKDDDGPTFPTYTPPSVKDDDEPIIPVVTPSDDKDDDDGTLQMLGLTPAQEEQAAAESQVSLDVFGGEGTPQVTIPTPAPVYAQPSQDPYAEAGRPTSRGSDRDDRPSAAQVAKKAAETAATKTAEAIDKTYNLSPTERLGGAALDKAYGITGLAKGGLASKSRPKKKATSKKRGLAARK